MQTNADSKNDSAEKKKGAQKETRKVSEEKKFGNIKKPEQDKGKKVGMFQISKETVYGSKKAILDKKGRDMYINNKNNSGNSNNPSTGNSSMNSGSVTSAQSGVINKPSNKTSSKMPK